MSEQKILILGALLMLTPFFNLNADDPKKIALLVGVNDYFDKNIEDLAYAENDVNVIANELKKLGFVVSKITNQSTTKSKVNSRIETFMSAAETLENNDIVLVMFSGHGQELRVQQTKTVSIEGSDKTIRKIGEVPYFCPRDAIPYDSAKHDLRGKSEEQVAEEFNLVSLNRVIGYLDSRSNSLRNLLVVDACRNNPAKGRTANITGGTTQELPRGLSILFAAKSGQKSWESSDLKIKHGVMSHYFINGLQGGAKDDYGEITWGNLTNFVKKSVIRDQGKLAGGADRLQNPHSINSSDDIIVLGKTAEKDSQTADPPKKAMGEIVMPKSNKGRLTSKSVKWVEVVDFMDETDFVQQVFGKSKDEFYVICRSGKLIQFKNGKWNSNVIDGKGAIGKVVVANGQDDEFAIGFESNRRYSTVGKLTNGSFQILSRDRKLWSNRVTAVGVDESGKIHQSSYLSGNSTFKSSAEKKLSLVFDPKTKLETSIKTGGMIFSNIRQSSCLYGVVWKDMKQACIVRFNVAASKWFLVKTLDKSISSPGWNGADDLSQIELMGKTCARFWEVNEQPVLAIINRYPQPSLNLFDLNGSRQFGISKKSPVVAIVGTDPNNFRLVFLDGSVMTFDGEKLIRELEPHDSGDQIRDAWLTPSGDIFAWGKSKIWQLSFE